MAVICQTKPLEQDYICDYEKNTQYIYYIFKFIIDFKFRRIIFFLAERKDHIFFKIHQILCENRDLFTYFL